MAKNSVYEMAIQIAGKVDSSLRKSCRDAQGYLDDLGESAAQAAQVSAAVLTAAATAAATAGAAGIAAYTQHKQAADDLAMATGAVGDQIEHLQVVMETVYQNNYGDSIEDVSDAVATVNQNLKNLPTDQIGAATEAALSLRDAFDYTTEETTRAAAAIEKNFGTSVIDAFSLIAAGSQKGLDYSGELLDTISEYSSQFSKLGFSADGMFNLLQSGADSTAWNLDKVGDAIKEFSIRSIDGSKTTIGAFQDLGYNASAMMQTFAAGGEGANEAFYDVLNTLMAVDDSVKRDAIGVALFGTMWEDLGTEAMQAMANASTAAYDAQDALEGIQDIQFADLESQMRGVRRQAEGMLVTIGEQLTPYAQEGLGYLSETVLPVVAEQLSVILPQLIEGAAALWENRDVILAIGAGILTAVAAYKAGKIAMTAYNAVMAIHKVITLANAGATLTAAQAAQMLNLKMFAIVGIIGAVVAALVWLYQNWDAVKAKATEVGAKIHEVWSTVNEVVTAVIAAIADKFPILGGVLEGMWTSISQCWENIEAIFSGIIDFVDNIFAGNWSAAWQNVVDIFANTIGLIENIARVPINAVIGLINGAINGINSISVDVPDWVPGFGGSTFGFNIPTIPMLADGGIAMRATQAIIGEGGEPEAILPLSKLLTLLESWGGGKPKGSGEGDDGDSISFAPVFNFYGSVTKEEAVEAGRISFAEFKRLYMQMKAEERRKVFAE